MCGIAGIIGKPTSGQRSYMRSMLKEIVHRGPDAEGIWEGEDAIFGHRRLSILDTSVSANQPMLDPSERFVLTYNGEIYNFLDIRQKLERKGHKFYTSSDTEVLIHAWQEWSIESVIYLEGMYAFAVWDRKERALYLVRDRFGEKPLFYFYTRDEFVFASELKALQQHPQCPKTINPQAISQFLNFNYILSDTCIFHGVYKLPAAHFLIYESSRDNPQIKCYWSLADIFRSSKHQQSEAGLLEEWTHLLDTTVQKTSISDVPLGAFLSGGIDSSAIVAAMTRNQDPQTVKTFSIGFQEDTFNELPKSKTVSQYLGVDHHTQIVDQTSLEDLERIIGFTGEPFADTSMIPTYYLSKFTRQSVTVSLSGDAGDELFAGYETYKGDMFYKWGRWIPGKKALHKLLSKLWPDSFQKVGIDYKMKKFMEGLGLPYQKAHVFWRSVFVHSEFDRLFSQDIKETMLKIDPYQSFLRFYDEVEDCAFLDQHLYADLKTWLVDDILVKVDRMSMAHSLEARAPFLNHRLAEWVIRLPTHLKMRYLRTKYFLKKSQERYLPHHIIYGKKEGFSAPVGHWFTNKTRDLTLESRGLKNWINPQYLSQLWSEHLERKRDNSYKLFGLICLAIWLDRNNHT